MRKRLPVVVIGIILILITLKLTTGSTGDEVPLARVSTVDSPFGINATGIFHHRDFAHGRKSIAFMKKIGARWDRFDFWWHVVEPREGMFKWNVADKVVDMYAREGIEMLPILCYSSAWSGKPPTTDEEVKLYGRFVYEVVNRYKDKIKYWEIWNEPNIPTFWDPPDVVWYTKMLIEAYKAAKKADPDCVIVAGVTSGTAIGYLRGIYENGGWDYLDVISFHPYSLAGGPIPQRLDRLIAFVGNLIEEKGQEKGIWITEIGWQTSVSLGKLSNSVIGEQTKSVSALKIEAQREQARNLLQTYVISLANGVDKVFWFCAWDFGDPWGLLDSTAGEKLSAKAYRTAVNYLEGSQFKGNLDFAFPIWGYVFERDEAPIVFLWSEKLTSVRMNFDKDGKVTDMLGQVVLEGLSGSQEIQVGEDPVIVSGLTSSYLNNTISREAFSENRNPNLVINPSFEEVDMYGGVFGWDVGTVYGTKKDGDFGRTTNAVSGNYAAELSNTRTAAWQSWTLTVDDSKMYRISAMINMTEATGKCLVQVTWLGGTGWGVLRTNMSEDIRETDGWEKFSWTLEPPKDAVFARIELVSIGNKGRILFDDIEMFKED